MLGNFGNEYRWGHLQNIPGHPRNGICLPLADLSSSFCYLRVILDAKTLFIDAVSSAPEEIAKIDTIVYKPSTLHTSILGSGEVRGLRQSHRKLYLLSNRKIAFVSRHEQRLEKQRKQGLFRDKHSLPR